MVASLLGHVSQHGYPRALWNCTHCVDTEQRYVELNFSSKNSDRLIANVPSNKNIAPPGYYMLFIIKKNNIPSVAPFVLLN